MSAVLQTLLRRLTCYEKSTQDMWLKKRNVQCANLRTGWSDCLPRGSSLPDAGILLIPKSLFKRNIVCLSLHKLFDKCLLEKFTL